MPERIAFKVKAQAEKAIKSGHPWIFESAIIKQSKSGKPGDLSVIYDRRNNKLLALGLYDPDSPVRIKVLHHGSPMVVDKQFFEGKFRTALSKRSSLLEKDTNSFRWIHGENDGLPSLIVDVYGEVAVMKLYARIWIPYIPVLVDIISAHPNVQTAVLRLSRSVTALSDLQDGSVLHGTLDSEVVVFNEYGVTFSANVIKGHKTGYFLDHRHNRHRVGMMSNSKDVLDVFSYAGGFSVHAAVRGARSVTSIDISKQALEVATHNMALNKHHANYQIIVDDAFNALSQLINQREKFDIVVIDPPSFAKKQTEVSSAIKSYERLAKLGSKLVKENGWLVLASCSSRVTSEQFFDACRRGIQLSRISFQLKDQTYHDVDHPVGFKEGAYLKCGYFKRGQ